MSFGVPETSDAKKKKRESWETLALSYQAGCNSMETRLPKAEPILACLLTAKQVFPNARPLERTSLLAVLERGKPARQRGDSIS